MSVRPARHTVVALAVASLVTVVGVSQARRQGPSDIDLAAGETSASSAVATPPPAYALSHGSAAPIALGTLVRSSDRDVDDSHSVARAQAAIRAGRMFEPGSVPASLVFPSHSSELVGTSSYGRVTGGGHGMGAVSGAGFGGAGSQRSSTASTAVHTSNRSTIQVQHHSSPPPAPGNSNGGHGTAPGPAAGTAPVGATMPTAPVNAVTPPMDTVATGLFGDHETLVADLVQAATGTGPSSGGGSLGAMPGHGGASAFAPRAASVSPTPEPGTLLLILTGGAVLTGRRLRRG